MRQNMNRTIVGVCLVALASMGASGCEYVRLLRPQTLKQLNPRVVRLVNYLPAVDHANEAIVGRLFPHGGLSYAQAGTDGVFRDEIRIPKNQYIWEPAVIVMPRGGELELTFFNDDQGLHMAFLPSEGERHILEIPVASAGQARIRLDHPGLYWFGCPVANHAGRGMLGLIIVEGEVPLEAKLDRPPQRRP
jgi:PQQ system protein